MATLQSARPIEYKLLEPLGEGAFSTVYKALRRDLEFDIEQTVALKILKSKIEIEKWREEFVSLERVRSNRCVRVLGWDCIENQPSLILEWIDGITLAQWVEYKAQQPRTILGLKTLMNLIDELCEQIVEGLRDIHAAEHVHGDLSLQNVMITPQGAVKLLDFGLALSKNVSFTAEFVAPELLLESPPSAQSDFYSLGRIREYLERRLRIPISQTTKTLLHHEPHQREYVCSFVASADERQGRQSVLAEDVFAATHHTQTIQKSLFETQVIQIVKNNRSWFEKLGYASIIAFSLSAGNAAPDTRPAHLFIKTKQWVEISVDGRRLGYSPVDIELIPGRSYAIEWKSKTQSGQRSLTPEPGQNMFISDQFFAP